MPKLYAKTQIILPGDVVVPARSVFDATAQQARQFDHLNSARPATEAEIKAAEAAKAVKDGQA
ncbi:hypothetical protein [uncultured Paracoccus sp.]|uniref:hypothetical protein n=1 Tax=uncultured Paracoccus sp. TaxID=189685 RepID=UPI0025ED34A6|nr:hypothetical protein [uncultured Paracoccus sp.]